MKTLSQPLDEVRIAAKLFAFRHHLRQDPGGEEAAHQFAARHWRRFEDMALDYLAVKLAIAEAAAEKKAGRPCPAPSPVPLHHLAANLADAAR